jgi:hypothetical protein
VRREVRLSLAEQGELLRSKGPWVLLTATLLILPCAPAVGDQKLIEALSEGKSERSKLKDQIARSKELGQLDVIPTLEERYEILTAAKFDPTLDEGTYQKDLDQDEWYLRSRRT